MRNFLIKLDRAGRSIGTNVLFTLSVPTVFLLVMEWMHRGTLFGDFWKERFSSHFSSYLLSWALLLAVYVLISHLTGAHWPAVFIVGLTCYMAGLVCYFKLKMRGEPFLPWDFSQLEELMNVSDKVKLEIEPFMVGGFVVFVFVFLVSWFMHLPYHRTIRLRACLIGSSLGLAGALYLIFGVYLQPTVTARMGIYPDMWMQDRYYKNYGVVSGFITNLTVLDIDAPEGYNEKTLQGMMDDVEKAAKTRAPMFDEADATNRLQDTQQPDIIYVMNESFWDVSRLEGISYDRELTPNLTQLKQEAASGYCFTPSFGGGTCDVEFEALTGFAITHLPAGCKPYQQHVTKDMFSLPQYLRSEGYQTVAVHGYYRKFWSRITAYPNLGIDTFVALEDFVTPQKRRGYISDAEMTRRVIEEYERRAEKGPVFVHAVTMQNHTTYDEKSYPADDLVQITEYPSGLSQTTLSQLRDFATGVHEADAALGELVAYFRNVKRPTILVFWGDHFNPVGKGYELYEKTGYIAPGDKTSPELRKTDLLIWSNFDNRQVDLGTLSAYNISPVMMELYGMEKPLYFEMLLQQMAQLRGRTHGITVQPDNTCTETVNDAQQKAIDRQWMMQYDLMFGEPYQKAYTPQEMA